jgi:hypothetical protein
MTILLHIAQGIFVLIAISWFRAFATRHPERLKALYVSIGFAGGALASFLLMAWWPLAVGFGAVVIGGTIIESTGSVMGEVARLHARYEVGASAEQRVEVATRMLDLALQKDSPKARHKALHKALDVVLCEGRFDDLEVGSNLHQKYWDVGHRIATEILKQQQYLNIQSVWFAEDYDEARQILGGQ